jgi:transposase
MARFVEGCDRGQSTLFPAVLDDYIGDDNAVRAIDVFVEGLDLAKLGFDGVEPLATGRPAYHPATQLKIYIYGYLNRIQSSRRQERECQRNVELVWLTGRLERRGEMRPLRRYSASLRRPAPARRWYCRVSPS